MQLSKGEIEGEERILTSLGDLLGVACHLGFNPCQARKRNKEQDKEREQGDRDEQREPVVRSERTA